MAGIDVRNQPTVVPNLAVAEQTSKALSMNAWRDEVTRGILNGKLSNAEVFAQMASGKGLSLGGAADGVAAIASGVTNSLTLTQPILDRVEARLGYNHALVGLLTNLSSNQGRKELQLTPEKFGQYRREVLSERTVDGQVKALVRVLGELPEGASRKLYRVPSLDLPDTSDTPRLPLSYARREFENSQQSAGFSTTALQHVRQGHDLDQVALNEATRFGTRGKYGPAKSILFDILGNETQQALSSISEEDKRALRQRTSESPESASAVESLRETLEDRRSAMAKVLSARAEKAGHPISDARAVDMIDGQIKAQLKNASESLYNKALEQEVIKRLPESLPGTKGESARELRSKYLDGQALHFSAEERDAFAQTALELGTIALTGGVSGLAGRAVGSGLLRAGFSRLAVAGASLETEAAVFTGLNAGLRMPSEGSGAISHLPKEFLSNLAMFGAVRGGALVWNKTGRSLLEKAYGVPAESLRDGMKASELALPGNAKLLNAIGSFGTEVAAFTAYGFAEQEVGNLLNGRPLGKDAFERLEKLTDANLKTVMGLKIANKVVGHLLEKAVRVSMGEGDPHLRERGRRLADRRQGLQHEETNSGEQVPDTVAQAQPLTDIAGTQQSQQRESERLNAFQAVSGQSVTQARDVSQQQDWQRQVDRHWQQPEPQRWQQQKQQQQMQRQRVVQAHDSETAGTILEGATENHLKWYADFVREAPEMLKSDDVHTALLMWMEGKRPGSNTSTDSQRSKAMNDTRTNFSVLMSSLYEETTPEGLRQKIIETASNINEALRNVHSVKYRRQELAVDSLSFESPQSNPLQNPSPLAARDTESAYPQSGSQTTNPPSVNVGSELKLPTLPQVSIPDRQVVDSSLQKSEPSNERLVEGANVSARGSSQVSPMEKAKSRHLGAIGTQMQRAGISLNDQRQIREMAEECFLKLSQLNVMDPNSIGDYITKMQRDVEGAIKGSNSRNLISSVRGLYAEVGVALKAQQSGYQVIRLSTTPEQWRSAATIINKGRQQDDRIPVVANPKAFSEFDLVLQRSDGEVVLVETKSRVQTFLDKNEHGNQFERQLKFANSVGASMGVYINTDYMSGRGNERSRLDAQLYAIQGFNRHLDVLYERAQSEMNPLLDPTRVEFLDHEMKPVRIYDPAALAY